MVKSRSIESSFRTMSKSGRKKVSFQDMEREVSPSRTWNVRSVRQHLLLSRPLIKVALIVSFKTIEETNNKSISLKTFDNWVKARTANCDTALKDALSFISEKKSVLDGEKDSPQVRPTQTGEIKPQQHGAKQLADRQPQ